MTNANVLAALCTSVFVRLFACLSLVCGGSHEIAQFFPRQNFGANLRDR
jgi:hypothetical protein